MKVRFPATMSNERSLNGSESNEKFGKVDADDDRAAIDRA